MLDRIKKWLDDHSPAWCWRCNAVMFTKDVRYAQHLVAGLVPLCPKCHYDLYGE